MDLGAVAAPVLGLAVLLFPGYAWVAALAPRLPAAKAVPLGIVVALTVTPGAMFALNVLFSVPIRVGTLAYLAVALGMMGLAARLAQPLLDAASGA